MKTLTIKLTELEYAKVKGYEATGFSIQKTLMLAIQKTIWDVLLDSNENDSTEDINEANENIKKYNEVFEKTLEKCGLKIKPEYRDEYLLKLRNEINNQ